MPSLLIPAAVTVAAGVGVGFYGSLYPQSQLFGPTLVAPPLPNQLALTFDDGPNPSATPRLLELLARHNVRATFFLLGGYVLSEPALTREILAAGHTIGNHTMHHPVLPRHTSAFIRNEIESCSRALEDILGTRPTLFRPPHGARRPAVLRLASELGMQTVQWNLIVGDWTEPPVETLLQRIESGISRNRKASRGTTLVLHDGGQHTPTANRQPTVDAISMLLNRLPPEVSFVTPPLWR